ncbi:hypothetical protein B0H14DRAFT_2594908 [Mycena olivaceomarginata]|nr:hypothetical protein B0H14DRAFT_2594908 [Mycena olivaceomarginata]
MPVSNLPSATGFDGNCFPNPYFAQDDVAIDQEKCTIDLSRGSPSPAPAESTPSPDHDDLPPLIAAELIEDEADSQDRVQESPEPRLRSPPPPSTLAYVPRTIANVFTQVLRLFNDDLVSANFRAMFGAGLGSEYPAIDHWYGVLEDDSYALRPLMASLAMAQLRNLAGVISAALNMRVIDMRGFEFGVCGFSVAHSALDECRLNFPSIILLLSARWTLLSRTFPSEDAVRGHVEDILHVIRFGVATIGKITARTLSYMEHSVCNPGAGIGMEQEEFLERVRFQPRFCFDVERWLDPLLLGDSSIRVVDTACGRLLRPEGFSVFIILDNGDSASILPFNHENDGDLTTRTYIEAQDLPELLFTRMASSSAPRRSSRLIQANLAEADSASTRPAAVPVNHPVKRAKPTEDPDIVELRSIAHKVDSNAFSETLAGVFAEAPGGVGPASAWAGEGLARHHHLVRQ